MKKLILSLFTLTIIGISCKKKDTPAPAAAIKYMSLASGSTWNYELFNNPAPTPTLYTITSTSKDSTINGRLYHVLTNSSGSANEYYNISGNDYYNFRSLPAALGGSSVEYIYLKDNAAAGASWSQSYPVTASGVSFTATLTNSITAKGISVVVKGTTYNNVIHVTTTISVSVGGVPLPAAALVTDIQSYYAENYGMIKSVNKINLNYVSIVSNTDQSTNLVTANLK